MTRCAPAVASPFIALEPRTRSPRALACLLRFLCCQNAAQGRAAAATALPAAALLRRMWRLLFRGDDNCDVAEDEARRPPRARDFDVYDDGDEDAAGGGDDDT